MAYTGAESPGTFAARDGDGPTAEFGGAELAGQAMGGSGHGRLITLGNSTMLVSLTLYEGFDQSGHSHPDHESIGYILSGRVRMRVGEEEHELGPGDTWFHPKGVHHTCFALEDCEILEFHAPLREDVLALFDGPSWDAPLTVDGTSGPVGASTEGDPG